MAAAFNLAANLILIPRYSYVAAAGVTIASEVVLLVPFLLALGGRVARGPLLVAALRPVPAAAVMAAALLFLGPWSRGIAAVVAAGVFLPALWVTRALDEREWRTLLGLVPGRRQVSRRWRAAR